jgi:hypothetical protein
LVDGEQVPLAGDSFEFVDSTIVEGKIRPGDEVLHCAGDKNLPSMCLGGDAGASVDRDPCDLAIYQLAFSRVQTGPNIEP